MREVKFRSWLKQKNEMLYDFTVMDHPTNTDTERFVLMQFTGLKDANGIEIYEGDIYHQGDENIKYVVVYHDTSFMGKQLRSSSFAGLEYWRDRIEVVGNIFENKNLLEDKR